MEGGDGGFDPCECICSYDGAMRRLISLVSTLNSNSRTSVSFDSFFDNIKFVSLNFLSKCFTNNI